MTACEQTTRFAPSDRLENLPRIAAGPDPHLGGICRRTLRQRMCSRQAGGNESATATMLATLRSTEL